MNGYYIFICAFVLLGIYCIVRGLRNARRLDPRAEGYEHKRKQEHNTVKGGVLLIILGVLIYLFKIAF